MTRPVRRRALLLGAGAAGRLDPARTALWCAESDSFYPAYQALVAALPAPPALTGHAPGGHTRVYWNSVTPAAFRFLGQALTRR